MTRTTMFAPLFEPLPARRGDRPKPNHARADVGLLRRRGWLRHAPAGRALRPPGPWRSWDRHHRELRGERVRPADAQADGGVLGCPRGRADRARRRGQGPRCAGDGAACARRPLRRTVGRLPRGAQARTVGGPVRAHGRPDRHPPGDHARGDRGGDRGVRAGRRAVRARRVRRRRRARRAGLPDLGVPLPVDATGAPTSGAAASTTGCASPWRSSARCGAAPRRGSSSASTS